MESKLTLNSHAAAALASLQPGHALVFATRHRVAAAVDNAFGHNVFPMRVRARITADRGASKTNAVPAGKPAPAAVPADSVEGASAADADGEV